MGATACLLHFAGACTKDDGAEKTAPEAVDMTSSKTTNAKIRWATCNLGASSEEKPGQYFKWGEDPCAEMLGPGWRIPTSKEFRELLDACTFEYVPYEEKSWLVGYHLISKYTGNSLYLPLWGYIDKQGETVEYNQEGYYLTSDENGEDEVYVLHASNQPGTKQRLITMDKSLSFQIRPVMDI